MSRARMIDIDSAKLDTEIQRRGITRQQASKAIGKCGDYLTDCIREGRISMPALEMLYKKFYISALDIEAEPEEEPEQVEITAEQKKEETAQDLEQTKTEIPLEVLPVDAIVKAITQGVREGVLDGFKAYFGEPKPEPVQVLADKWKIALHGMEEKQ